MKLDSLITLLTLLSINILSEFSRLQNELMGQIQSNHAKIFLPFSL